MARWSPLPATLSDDPPVRAAGAVGSGDEPSSWPLSLPQEARIAARMADWLDAATDSTSPDTWLFAKLIAARDARNELALLGLEPAAWYALLARHFARAVAPAAAVARIERIAPTALPPSFDAGTHAGFVRTLRSLMLTHTGAAIQAGDAQCLASIVAHACLRPDHLWRDLGLAGRDEVTWMLTRYFPTLVALNVADLRWKKFLAGQWALSFGLQPGPSPGCPGCEDYGYCFPGLR